jgi:hypothetical protein
VPSRNASQSLARQQPRQALPKNSCGRRLRRRFPITNRNTLWFATIIRGQRPLPQSFLGKTASPLPVIVQAAQVQQLPNSERERQIPPHAFVKAVTAARTFLRTLLPCFVEAGAMRRSPASASARALHYRGVTQGGRPAIRRGHAIRNVHLRRGRRDSVPAPGSHRQ